MSTIIMGSVEEGSKYWSVVDHLKRQLAQQYAKTNPYMSQWVQLSADAKVFINLVAGQPRAFIYVGGVVYIAFADNTNTVTQVFERPGGTQYPTTKEHLDFSIGQQAWYGKSSTSSASVTGVIGWDNTYIYGKGSKSWLGSTKVCAITGGAVAVAFGSDLGGALRLTLYKNPFPSATVVAPDAVEIYSRVVTFPQARVIVHGFLLDAHTLILENWNAQFTTQTLYKCKFNADYTAEERTELWSGEGRETSSWVEMITSTISFYQTDGTWFPLAAPLSRDYTYTITAVAPHRVLKKVAIVEDSIAVIFSETITDTANKTRHYDLSPPEPPLNIFVTTDDTGSGSTNRSYKESVEEITFDPNTQAAIITPIFELTNSETKTYTAADVDHRSNSFTDNVKLVGYSNPSIGAYASIEHESIKTYAKTGSSSEAGTNSTTATLELLYRGISTDIDTLSYSGTAIASDQRYVGFSDIYMDRDYPYFNTPPSIDSNITTTDGPPSETHTSVIETTTVRGTFYNYGSSRSELEPMRGHYDGKLLVLCYSLTAVPLAGTLGAVKRGTLIVDTTISDRLEYTLLDHRIDQQLTSTAAVPFSLTQI